MYEANTDCSWLISVADNSNIEVYIDDFDIEGSDTCQYDYLAVSHKIEYIIKWMCIYMFLFERVEEGLW